METKGVLGMGLALMLAAGGASMSAVSLAQAESAKQETKSEGQDKKDLKQGEKPVDTADEKTRGFKKGQKPTETMGTMGKEKGKDTAKP
ncbi:MAG TPA: hypothetical protein VF879_04910 [Nitrospirales bacterium]